MRGKSSSRSRLLFGALAIALIPLRAAPAIADTSDESTLTGSVTMPGGAPAVGVRVIVVTTGTPTGGAYQTVSVLGETRTGAGGEFKLDLLLNPSLAPPTNASGQLNVAVVALLDSADQRYSGAFYTPLEPVGQAFLPVAEPIALSLQAVSFGWGTSCYGDYAAREVLSAAYRDTKVGELHAWDDMTCSFIYEEGGEHKVDTGVSQSAGDGTFKVSGTKSIDKDSTVSQGPKDVQGRYGYILRPTMRYEKVAYCIDRRVSHYATEAVYASGGFGAPQDVSYKDGPDQFARNNQHGKMGHFGPNDFFAKDTGVTKRYEAAAEAWGFKFGAVSQHSQKLKFTWKMGTQFGSATDRQYHLWGDGPDPASSPTLYAYSGPTPNDDDFIFNLDGGCGGPGHHDGPGAKPDVCVTSNTDPSIVYIDANSRSRWAPNSVTPEDNPGPTRQYRVVTEPMKSGLTYRWSASNLQPGTEYDMRFAKKGANQVPNTWTFGSVGTSISRCGNGMSPSAPSTRGCPTITW